MKSPELLHSEICVHDQSTHTDFCPIRYVVFPFDLEPTREIDSNAVLRRGDEFHRRLGL